MQIESREFLTYTTYLSALMTYICLSQLMDTSDLTHIMNTLLVNKFESVQGQCFETVI